jgi:ubiquinol-cytochrome c reductase cytochrome c1 subunit
VGVWASGGSHARLDSVNIDLGDKASLRRGAHTFINYCLSCHSAKHMRYERIAKDLGIGNDIMRKNMMFTTDKIGSLMKATMPAADAAEWFGVAPPDLTLATHFRSPDWIYTYLRSYKDKKIMVRKKDKDGKKIMVEGSIKVFDRFEIAMPGTMSEKDFNAAMRDLTNFMVYLGDPSRLVRYKIGAGVMIFLFIFLFVAYLLKKNFWQDIDH